MGKMKRRPPRGMGGPKPAGKNDMMKQIQQMQEEMQRAQEALDEQIIEGTAGGGAVKATVTGTRQFKSIEINPEVVDPDDVEMLQDLVLAAVNGALKMSDDKTNESMSRIQGGMSIPGLF